MNGTANRLLRLLALLQSGRPWSGAALSERLEVDRRTVRRDIDRLRSLGYAVHASSGPGGGYRFGAGTRLPPLLLDDDEAVAVMVALRIAAGGLARIEQTASAVRAKLEQIMPRRLKARLDALESMIVPLDLQEPIVEPGRLTALASACRDRRGLGFGYRDGRGRRSARRVEPQRLVHAGYRWYLVAWDLDRVDWRIFRVDRMDAPTVGEGFAARDFPGDVAAYVQRGLSRAPQPHRARVELSGSAAAHSQGLPGWAGVLEELDESRCVLTVGAQSRAALVGLLIGLDLEFRVLEPADLTADLRAAATRLRGAITRGAGPDPPDG